MAIQSGDNVVITFPEVVKLNTKLDKGQMAYVRQDNEPILYIGNSSDAVPYPPNEFSEEENALKPVNVADGAIRTKKLADKAVTREKLADGAVTFDKLNEEVKSNIENIRRQAEQAQETADSVGDRVSSAIDTANEAMYIADEAKQNANTAMSIAKGANQAETFDTEWQMNRWINGDGKDDKGQKVDSVNFIEGMVLTENSTIIYSVADEGNIDYEADAGCLYINGEEIYGFRSSFATILRQQGRYFFIYVLPRDITINKIGVTAEIRRFGGGGGATEILYKTNPHFSYTEEKLNEATIRSEGIDFDLIKSHNINIGQNFYIRDVGVPDYWWDGGKAQPLETQKVDLTDIENGLQSILDAVNNLIGGES